MIAMTSPFADGSVTVSNSGRGSRVSSVPHRAQTSRDDQRAALYAVNRQEGQCR